MSSAHSLTWLHLSDLHLRKCDDWDSRTITEALIRDLKQLQDEYGLRPDLIFFTGDAAFGATPGDTMAHQYQQVRKFFDAIRQCFTPEVPLRDLYVVPGNHDIDRAEITPGEMAWLRHSSRTLVDITSAMRDVTKQWRTWMDRLGHYRTFLTTSGLLHLEPDNPQLIWADAKEIAGIRVGIAGLNSAWSCADDSDKGRLWCGADWQIAQVKERMGPVAISFALIHHPGNWFTDREDPRLMRRLRQEFPVVLHGHEHQDWVDIDGDDRLVVSAGACYQCSWMENGYSFGRLDVRDRSGQVWLRRWDDTGRGWVAREVASKTRHGIWTLPALSWLPASGENTQTAEGRTTAAPSRDPDEPGESKLTAEDHYTQRYCRHVVDQYDVLELFGCDIPRELQRHQLSVAYVSLNLASEEDEKPSSDGAPLVMGDEDGEHATFAPDKDPRTEKDAGEASASIEYVLDNVSRRTNRLMILGPAGAGKSTLVRWCAIAAAQRTLNPPAPGAGDLNAGMKRIMLDARYSVEKPGSERVSETWRDKIPFLIRLRDCSDGRLPAAADLQRFVAKHLPTAPPEWIIHVLDGGHALILFDGVDEVHRDKRTQLADEIGDMIRAYPRCTYVVTTRPGAVERGWLERMEFVEARVEPMGRIDREEFIDKWYRSAALELRKRPRPNEDLSATAARLKNELTDQPELGTLASNPLLCAMICALYRERQEHLPETPAELSEALVHMLLHRRERETPGLQDAHFPATWRALQYSQKKGLLAELAWRMVSEEESSTTLKAAESVLGVVLASTPGRGSHEAAELLQAIIERSGLLRPAGDGQIDFLHNTLKEYLAAGRAVEAADWKTLAEHADDPAWQPVILFSLALAPEPFSSSLVGELLARTSASPSKKPSRRKKDRIDLKTANARELFLVRCRGAAKRLAPDMSERIDVLTAGLFPPANMQEVEALAPLGARILAYAGPRLMDANWWAQQNARTVYRCLRLLRLIGGQKATDALTAIKRLPDHSSLVTGEWIAACHELSKDVPPWPFDGASRIDAHGNSRLKDLSILSTLPKVKWLNVSWTSVTDLTTVSHLTSLEVLDLSNTAVSSLEPLKNLISLRRLELMRTRVTDLGPLRGLSSLQLLDLMRVPVSDLEPLSGLAQLIALYLRSSPIYDLRPLAGLSSLRTLYAVDCKIVDLAPLAGLQSLQHLYLNDNDIKDLEPLRSLTALLSVSLGRNPIIDLLPVGGLVSLTSLSLDNTQVSDLTPLRSLHNLQSVSLAGAPASDLGPIMELKSLKRLSVAGHVPAEEIARFRKKRPDVDVHAF